MTGTAQKIFGSCLIALVWMLCASAHAQASSDQPAVTFKSRSELVLVPVIVADRRGGHVAGLKKEDFSLRENGIEQKIAVFDEVVASNDRIVGPKRAESVYTNTVGTNSAKRLVILALDAINTPINDQIRARKQMLKFLSEGIDRDALVSVVVLTPAGVKVVHDFTTDTSVLIAAVSKARGKSAFSEQTPDAAVDDSALDTETAQLSALTDNTNQSAVAGQKQVAIRWTYDAFTQIAQAYAGVPGRKSLIWVTAGFPFSFADNNNRISAIGGNGDVSDNLDAYERMWQALTEANFAVYPVDARGFVNTAVMPASAGARSTGSGKSAPPSIALTQMTAQNASIDTFRDLAEMTGGKAFFNTNDLARSFRQASNDSATYYVLGFYLPKVAQPGWHSLKVKIDRSGTQVRARSGYLVATKSRGANVASDVRNAIVSPFDSTVLPLEVRWSTRDRGPEEVKTTASFKVQLTPAAISVDETDNNHISFDVIAVAKNPDGSIAGTLERPFDAHIKAPNLAKFQQAGMFYEGKLQLPAGKYLVRVVVEDRLTGKVGSVSAPLIVK